MFGFSKKQLLAVFVISSLAILASNKLSPYAKIVGKSA
jgi:hypothetical protein